MLVAGMKNNSKYNNNGLFQFCFYITYVLKSK